MSTWQTKLQSFIDQRIIKEMEDYKQNNDLTEDEAKTIKAEMQDLAMIEDASSIEPILRYLDKEVTPREHLQDLLNQLRNDIYPLFKAPSVTPGGAPFTVLRNIFSYLDYTALLRYGPSGSYGKGMGDIGKLLDNFGPVDMQERYRLYKNYLIQIYRHDLIHLISPRLKIMKVKKGKEEKIKKVGFVIISDTFNDGNKDKRNQILENFEQGCSLMKSVQFRKNTFFHLRLRDNTPTINSISMFFDLVNYIKEYQVSLANEEELNRRFAENFIVASLNSALKLLDKQNLDVLENKHLFFNSMKFKKS